VRDYTKRPLSPGGPVLEQHSTQGRGRWDAKKNEEFPAHLCRSLFQDDDVEDDDSVLAVKLDQSTVQNIVPARAQDGALKEYTSPKSKNVKPPIGLLTPQSSSASRTPTNSEALSHETEETAAKNLPDQAAAIGNHEARRTDASSIPAGLSTPAKHQPLAHLCSPSTLRLPGAQKKALIMNTPEVAPVNFYKHGTPSPVIAQTSRRGVIDAPLPELPEEKRGRIVDAAQ